MKVYFWERILPRPVSPNPTGAWPVVVVKLDDYKKLFEETK